ncbi:hypothetical protein [Paenibacillus agricola]|uniref:CHAD domain-containing protein n=1 Tax=Paenibacillus agricola TaxID=2716264 RepID=A0ABX0JG83_9BACL|nr:hypothetical protein [Paenibacillus agricola]NHN34390.1 hypothetical protein [Paenibacillus agricola]
MLTNTQKVHLFYFEKAAEELLSLVKGKKINPHAAPVSTMRKRLAYLKTTIKKAEKRESKLRAFDRLRVRLNRTARLLDLGSPTIIIESEICCIKRQIGELRLVLNGVRPKLDYSERQEFIELNEIEVVMSKLPIRERVYIMNEHLLGYRFK